MLSATRVLFLGTSCPEVSQSSVHNQRQTSNFIILAALHLITVCVTLYVCVVFYIFVKIVLLFLLPEGTVDLHGFYVFIFHVKHIEFTHKMCYTNKIAINYYNWI